MSTSKNGSHVKKWVTFRKTGPTLKNGLNVKKGHAWKSGSLLEKRVRLGEMGHS